MPLDVLVVSHTHWDREWYHPAARFRQRLVALIDELLENPPTDDASFLLDGQGIVLDDYLDVRPDRRDRLASLLQGRRLEAGPWYVLADELIPSGEALVRNLLAGRAALHALGAAPPPVLYCPDSFGHPAILPELAAGFGLPVIIAWRGFGSRRWPAGDTHEWRAQSGASAVLFHLPKSGYELGSSLPEDAPAMADRWAALRGELAGRTTTGLLLVQNGADHHARQAALGSALRLLADAAAPDQVRATSLAAFADTLLHRAARARLPRVTGELRDSYGYTWTLQGTLATRAHQKRANARVERLLVRDSEPWVALASRAGAPLRTATLAAAWRTLLRAHPHDTLCGCSIDDVARAMDDRLASARAQAIGLRDDALLDLAGHDPVVARERRAEWRPVVVVRNCAPRARGGVAELEIERFVADVPVGPGSGAAPPPQPATRAKPPALEGVPGVQLLDVRTEHRRIESPRHYPDNDLVEVSRVLTWLPPVNGYGLAAYPIAERRARTTPAHPAVTASGLTMENDRLRVTVGTDGAIAVDRKADGRRIEGLLAFEDRVDVGDLYTPAPRDTLGTARCEAARLVAHGPFRASVLTRWRIGTGGRSVSATADVEVALDAASPFVRLVVRGENRVGDHQLRILLRTEVRNAEVWADAAFGPIRREPLVLPPEDAAMEQAQATAPLHRYVTLVAAGAGATVISDGLAEYEAMDDGTIAVTLVRAVGELSRNDLPERPGHAGWPAPTPDAQCIGPFEACLAFVPHGPRDDETVDAIERAADDFLLPLTGTTLRSALGVPAATLGAELSGPGLAVSAIKPAEQGRGVVLRCVNLLERPTRGHWKLGFPATSASLARLDETPISPVSIDDAGVIAFDAPPRAVVTILVR